MHGPVFVSNFILQQNFDLGASSAVTNAPSLNITNFKIRSFCPFPKPKPSTASKASEMEFRSVPSWPLGANVNNMSIRRTVLAFVKHPVARFLLFYICSAL
jgi:hypothetical protein